MIQLLPPLPRAWLRGGHLAALWTLAFVQPLLDLLGRNPEFFVARGNGRADILIFSLALALGPPLLMLALETLIERVSDRLTWGLHLVLVGALASAIALQALKGMAAGPAGVLIGASIALGSIAALAYWLRAAVRSLTTFLIPAPAVILAFFLFLSDASELVLPQDDPRALAASGDGDAPMVLIFFDELPAASLMDAQGRIDARRFPSFARLSRRSTWYRNATTVADHTDEAVPAILTGSRPRAGLDPIASDYPRTLFTLVGGSYRMNVSERSTRLCPDSICGTPERGSLSSRLRDLVSDLSLVSEHLLLPEAIARRLPPVDENFSEFRAHGAGDSPERDRETEGLRHVGVDVGEISSFLSGIGDQRRSLHFIDLTLPHVPWRYLPSGQRYQSTSVAQQWLDESERWLPYRWVTNQGLQAHLLQTGYADALLGEMISRLRRVGIWREALVAVLSDHGGSFTPRASRRFIERRGAGEIASVVAFIKAPGQRRGRIDDRPLRSIDVLPTIADEVGLRLPFAVDGRPPRELGRESSVTVFRKGSGPRRFGFGAVVRARERLAARIAALFGSGRGWARVYRIGPHRGLIGERVDALEVVGGSEVASVELADSELYRDVDPDGSFVPSLIQGTLEGVSDRAALAVVVNGRIAAVTRAYRSLTGVQRMVALVPPRAFRPGTNAIEIYRLEPAAGATVRLAPLTG